MSKTAAVDSTLSAAKMKYSPVVVHFTIEYLQCKYVFVILNNYKHNKATKLSKHSISLKDSKTFWGLHVKFTHKSQKNFKIMLTSGRRVNLKKKIKVKLIY